MVSIGPRFKGSREDLLLMEETKLRCLNHLVSRSEHGINTEMLKLCCKKLMILDKLIRSSYVVDINMEPYELAKTMLVDCCFLLELLISKEFDALLPSRSGTPNPAYELLRDEDVLSDIILLENQIPIILLYEATISLRISRTLNPFTFLILSTFSTKDKVRFAIVR